MEASRLRKFNLRRAINANNETKQYLIIGGRACGKTTLASEIYKHVQRKTRFTICVTPFPLDYHGIIPLKSIHYAYSSDLMEGFISRQNDSLGGRPLGIDSDSFTEGGVATSVQAQTQIGSRTPSANSLDMRAAIILDDCLYPDSSIRGGGLRVLRTNAKSLSTNLIFTTQSYDRSLDQPKPDYVFIFWDPNISSRREIFRAYQDNFPSFEYFESIMHQYARQKYTCLVLNLRNKGGKLRDKIFWHRAYRGYPDENKISAETISDWWSSILAKRRLCRLRIAKELELYPGIGIKYHEAMDRFISNSNPKVP